MLSKENTDERLNAYGLRLDKLEQRIKVDPTALDKVFIMLGKLCSRAFTSYQVFIIANAVWKFVELKTRSKEKKQKIAEQQKKNGPRGAARIC